MGQTRRRLIMQTTPQERAELARHIEAIRFQLPYPIAPLDGVRICWDNQDSSKRKGHGSTKLAYFTIFKPRQITLAGFGRHHLEGMVPWLAHELRHMWQYQYLGCIGFMCVSIFRKWKLEPSAYAVTEAAEKLMMTTEKR